MKFEHIALWVKDGNNGKFFSVKISEPYKKDNPTKVIEQPEGKDLPF